MEQFALAVGPDTMILPILNGMAHIDSLSMRFGADHVLGGSAMISATLDTEGRIVLFVPTHDLVFGELAGGSSDRTISLMAVFDRAGFNPRVSDIMLQEMWGSGPPLATNAGMTCMMRPVLAISLTQAEAKHSCAYSTSAAPSPAAAASRSGRISWRCAPTCSLRRGRRSKPLCCAISTRIGDGRRTCDRGPGNSCPCPRN